MADRTSSPFFEELLEHFDAESVQNLFAEKENLHVERLLLETFSPHEVKIYRGLPRLYHKERPQESRLKGVFAHLPSLRALLAEKFLFPLYDIPIALPTFKVALFSWVVSDGWGDFIAAKEVALLLQEKGIEVVWVAMMPESMMGVEGPTYAMPYRPGEVPFLSAQGLALLRKQDFILSLPTYYPETKRVQETLANIPEQNPLPRWLCLGQYGYLESGWFHPRSDNRSMGLHFLEKGILCRKALYPDFAQVENRFLCQFLFGAEKPTIREVEKYLSTHKFYLAYLVSPVGGAIYLHALLKSQMHFDAPIDICTPEIGWLIRYLEGQKKQGKSFLEGNFRVAHVEIYYEGEKYPVFVAPEGKVVRIFCPGPLSDRDFRFLVRCSEDFLGVRGDQSFSEAISAGKTFFYDGALHARYFLKDLVALAENRLSEFRGAQIVFRGMGKAFLHQIAQEDGEWVEDTYFQEKEAWPVLANQIGKALMQPETASGFRRISKIVLQEHSIHPFLHHLLQRERLHREFPRLQGEEKRLLSSFVKGDSSFLFVEESLKEELQAVLRS